MYQDRVVLCAASAYEQKFYLAPDFDGLPETIKNELKILCVLFTEDVGGIIELIFEEDGRLVIETTVDETDLLYDEIGAVLKVKELQKTREELFSSLEMYYKVFFLGEDFEEE